MVNHKKLERDNISLRKLKLVIIILSLPFLLTSCWGNEEINNHAVVGVLAVDKTQDGNIQLTAEILKPKGAAGNENYGGSQEQTPFFLITGTGKTYDDAKAMLQTHIPRLLYWANCDFIIIGENMALDGIKDLFNYLRRDIEIRQRDLIYVTKGYASDALKPLIYIANSTNVALRAYNQQADSYSKSYFLSDLNKITQSLLGTRTNTVIGRIQISDATNDIEKKLNKYIEKYELRFEGAGVFKQDALVGWLNGTETRGLLWIEGEVVTGPFAFTCPVDDKDVKITVNNMIEKTKIKTIVKNEKIEFKVDIYAEGDVTQWDSDKTLNDPDLIKKINKEYSRAIKDEVNAVLKKAQKEYKTDFCGFGEELYKHKSEEWLKIKENWDDIFTTVNIEVKVIANIHKIGLAN